MSRPKPSRLLLMPSLLLSSIVTLPCAQAGAIDDAIAASRPLLDMRLRYERVDQPVTPSRTAATADALTARLRAGFETGKAWHTSLLVEGEFVDDWVDDYNSTANGRSTHPVVADPRVTELNRFSFTNTGLRGTTVTLGRQRINLDDQRFVGSVGWRQNEQTLDALRIVATPRKALTADLTYSSRVHRVFGEHSITQLPAWRGDVLLANLGWQLPPGKLSAFAYVLDLENDALNSSATAGLRFQGERAWRTSKLRYSTSWARQSDHADNPVDYDTSFLQAELGATVSTVTGTVGYERLGGDGTRGFATPLATLHRFQGWADAFLTTPASGIEDAYASLAWSARWAAFDAVSANVVYHRFDSAGGSTGLGDEIDVIATAKRGRVSGSVKYAHYAGASAAQDIEKLWFELSMTW